MIISAGQRPAEAAPSLCIEKPSLSSPAARVALRSSRKRCGPRGSYSRWTPTRAPPLADDDSSKAWPTPDVVAVAPADSDQPRAPGAGFLGLTSHQDAAVVCGTPSPHHQAAWATSSPVPARRPFQCTLATVIVNPDPAAMEDTQALSLGTLFARRDVATLNTRCGVTPPRRRTAPSVMQASFNAMKPSLPMHVGIGQRRAAAP